MPSSSADLNCRLCNAPGMDWCVVDAVPYQRCAECGLIQMHARRLPARDEEKAVYDWHENDPGDAGYRNFLNRLAQPLIRQLAHGARGLDYGCGPGPALAMMLAEQGFPSALYDPIYRPHRAVLNRRYDFITCTEVVEHFHQPGQEFHRLAALLKPGGILAVMTTWYHDGIDFQRWHYRRDPTHVCFYQRQTFAWIAAQLGMAWYNPVDNVVLMQG